MPEWRLPATHVRRMQRLRYVSERGPTTVATCQCRIAQHTITPHHRYNRPCMPQEWCRCPDSDWGGTQCQFARSQSACAAGLEFDGGFVNVHESVEKVSSECFTEYAKLVDDFVGLRDHRISITAYAHNKTVDAVIKARTRQPDTDQCGATTDAFSCKFSECNFYTDTSEDVGAVYECFHMECSACTEPGCNPLLPGILSGINGYQEEGLKITFAAESKAATGSSDAVLGIPILALNMRCYSGACVSGIDRNEVTPQVEEQTLKPAAKYVAISVCAMATVAVLLAAAALNRRPSSVVFDDTAVDKTEGGSTGVELVPLGSDVDRHSSMSDANVVTIRANTLLNNEGFALAWRNLSFTVRDNRRGQSERLRTILSDCTGCALPGEVTALVGPSGCGKTTLLDALAGHRRKGTLQADVALCPLSDQGRQARVAFVHQESMLYESETAYETVEFAARVSRRHWPALELRTHVMEALQSLGVAHAWNTRVAALSGGERRRVAIAARLVQRPDVLLLDEPTSGLDSSAAARLVRLLRRTARARRCCIVLSVHQPSERLWREFDRVCALNKEGRTLLSTKRDQVPDFLGRLRALCSVTDDNTIDATNDGTDDGSTPSNDATDPAGQETAVDDIIDVVGVEDVVDSGCLEDRAPGALSAVEESLAALLHEVRDAGEAEQLLDICDAQQLDAHEQVYQLATRFFEESEFHERLRQQVNDLFARRGLRWIARCSDTKSVESDDEANEDEALDAVQPCQRPRWPLTTLFLTKRLFRHAARDISLLGTQYLASVLVAVVVGIVFWQFSINIDGAQNRVGAVFFFMLYFVLTSTSAAGAFFYQRLTYMRERAAGWYGPSHFVTATLLADLLPLRLVPALIIGCIDYWMMGFRDDGIKFSQFLLVFVACATCAGAAVLFIVSVSPSARTAQLGAILFGMFCVLFGGVLVNTSSQSSKFVNTLKYVSFCNYAFEALVWNEFHELPMVWKPDGFPTIKVDGDLFLQQVGVSDADFLFSFCMLLAWTVFFILGSYVALRSRKRISHHR
ncbi:MAG: hypothetical protein MHM6MM_003504 [Cercozoa sp. M6MM]